ncbi:MAG TPA: tetratricopeptide repeat protein [Anaeromyxobacter sp.]
MSNPLRARDAADALPSPAPRWHLWAAILTLGALGIAAYWGSLDGVFNFDDNASIRNNPLIRSLSDAVSLEAYRARPTRWIGYLTFALNYRLGGLEPRGYHAVNLAVHLANALLVFALVRLLFRTPALRGSSLAGGATAVAWVAAALFVAHPIQTEAVSYVVQRVTSLATTFYVLAAVLYLRWRLAREAGRRDPVSYAGVLLSSLLAVKTKEISFTLPLALALLEAALFGWRGWRRWLPIAPVAALALLIPLPYVAIGSSTSVGETLSSATAAARVDTPVSRWQYLVTQAAVVARYVRLLFLPVGQNLDYDFPLARSVLEPRVLGGAALILALLAGSLWLLGSRRIDPAGRAVAVGILWFFVALSVESTLLPIRDVILEHRVYLPSVGAFAALATAAAWLARRLVPSRPWRALVAAGALAACALSAATVARNEVWASELALWSDSVRKSPGKSRPHCNLGKALAELHREAEAIPELREAVRLDPSYGEAYGNLGAALAARGESAAAVAVLRRGIEVAPRYGEAHYNLGRVLVTLDRPAEAEPLLRRAIELQPGHAGAYANLGAALNRLGRFAETVALLRKAPGPARDSPEARFNLAVACAYLGDAPGAWSEARRLSETGHPLAAQLESFLRSR